MSKNLANDSKRRFPLLAEGWSFVSFTRYLSIAVLNSYGMLFFSRNKVLSMLILLVSFFTPFTGACGLIALLTALFAAFAVGFGKEEIQRGLLTYSVILFGLGFGTNFEMGTAFAMLLIIGSLLTLFLSIALNAVLNKRGLPALSLAFIISTCIIITASKNFAGIGLTHRHIYWFNEAYALGGSTLVNIIQQIEELPMPEYVAGFFRSMSAIIFQINIASGILLTIGLLIYSRIAFMLMILGYAVAIGFTYVMGGFHFNDMTYYNMGTNFMLVAVALGGFYLIPSLRSFLWLFITVPIACLLVVAVGSITFKMGVPFFSLPFCLVVILFLYTLQLRKKADKLVLTPLQFYHPETNLYRYINGKERSLNRYYHQLFLPFMGKWMVSQGHDSTITHKGEWGKALDFVILDNEMKTYRLPGNLPEHFHCYNKPITSPSDGIVEEIWDHVEDNEIGKSNRAQNWGNSIVIKHAEGLYTKLSHLKKNSFRVTKGSFVKRGDILAVCGNSGRSPEPHLHFQVQSTPYIGSKTMVYPLAYYIMQNSNGQQFENFSVPKEGTFAANILPNIQLQKAFSFQPGYILRVMAHGFAEEEWEVMTNMYNEPYLHCKLHNTFAYFINNGTVFYFTSYFGKKNTLLYYFYLAAYKILLSSEKPITVTDNYPLTVFGFHPLKWVQDFAAPFFIFMKMKYSSSVLQNDGLLPSGKIEIKSRQSKEILIQTKQTMNAALEVENGQLQSFKIELPTQTILATCKA